MILVAMPFRINNCRDAMKLARQHFGIPLVLRPEDLANSNLDELSAITYLSYFTKVGAPGYNATLQRIQPLVRSYPVFNFTVSLPLKGCIDEIIPLLERKKNVQNHHRTNHSEATKC